MQQSQSFVVNCFYDSYVGDVKRGDADNESESYKCEYYDRAQMYTSQCVSIDLLGSLLPCALPRGQETGCTNQ